MTFDTTRRGPAPRQPARWDAESSETTSDGAETVDAHSSHSTEVRLGQVLIAAHELLSVFIEPARLADRLGALLALRPQDGDYARVFRGPAAAAARAGYEPLWQSSPPVPFRPTHTELRVAVALAEDFAEGGDAAAHERAASFPAAYDSIGDQLCPGIVWVSWELLEPGAREGLRFDGLVWLSGRWVWFPKPWRVLAPAHPDDT